MSRPAATCLTPAIIHQEGARLKGRPVVVWNDFRKTHVWGRIDDVDATTVTVTTDEQYGMGFDIKSFNKFNERMKFWLLPRVT